VAAVTYTPWTADDAARTISIPGTDDDKYTRGVLGVITGSTQYPGAAVLGVEAALHTGVGMVRYLGPERPATLVLQHRPEAVTADGRVQAWLIGSGIATIQDSDSAGAAREAMGQGVPVVLDGGALDLCAGATAPVVITPHFRELAGLVGGEAADIARDPGAAAARAADSLGVTVLLKGHTTYIAAPDGTRLSASTAPTWLATAGAGDALGGILGALVATHASDIAADVGALARLAASASVIHGLAAERASAGGPFAVLELASAVAPTIGELLRLRSK
jgi:NAD(P)H-hydrate repair Nnr-like enzyme with NAD(P)H-hydrate dehydratase domain